MGTAAAEFKGSKRDFLAKCGKYRNPAVADEVYTIGGRVGECSRGVAFSAQVVTLNTRSIPASSAVAGVRG